MPDVFELSRFRVDPEKEGDFRASYPACVDALHAFDGFKDVSLSRLDTGEYVFAGIWATREHCHAAMEKAMNVEGIATFLSYISEDISMEFGDVLSPGQGVAQAA